MARTRHHRKCKSNHGGNERSNISFVTKGAHRAWHLLFANMNAYGIAKVINEIWLDPYYELIVVKRKRRTTE